MLSATFESALSELLQCVGVSFRQQENRILRTWFSGESLRLLKTYLKYRHTDTGPKFLAPKLGAMMAVLDLASEMTVADKTAVVEILKLRRLILLLQSELIVKIETEEEQSDGEREFTDKATKNIEKIRQTIQVNPGKTIIELQKIIPQFSARTIRRWIEVLCKRGDVIESGAEAGKASVFHVV